MQFIKEIFSYFLSKNSFQKGASLAYYAIFSLVPMVIIAISILGFFFGKEAVSGDIFAQFKDILGKDVALQIQDLIKNHHTNYNNTFTAIVGFVTLIISASGMFSQIHNSLNDFWNIKSKPKNSILKYASQHFFAFIVVLFLFFTLFASVSLHSFFIKYADSFTESYQLVYVYEHLISFLILGILFSVMFKLLGDAILNWKIIILGGSITSILFMVGKIGIGWYIGHQHINSVFGSASTLVIIMLWVYYVSQIILLGAAIIYVLSSKFGYEVLPNTNAVKIKSIEIG